MISILEEAKLISRSLVAQAQRGGMTTKEHFFRVIQMFYILTVVVVTVYASKHIKLYT